jgi:hypothetical protein
MSLFDQHPSNILETYQMLSFFFHLKPNQSNLILDSIIRISEISPFPFNAKCFIDHYPIGIYTCSKGSYFGKRTLLLFLPSQIFSCFSSFRLHLRSAKFPNALGTSSNEAWKHFRLNSEAFWMLPNSARFKKCQPSTFLNFIWTAIFSLQQYSNSSLWTESKLQA